MTYHAQWQLTFDDPFSSRCRACLTNRSKVYMDDERPDIAALAKSILRDDSAPIHSFLPLLAAFPGFDDTVDMGDGTINSDKLSDVQILSAVEAEFPTVATLYYGTLTPEPPAVIPEVTGVSPLSGPAATPITVTGLGLTDATLVNVGYDCTNLVVISDNELTAAIANPKPSKGYYPVLVTVGGNVVTGPEFQVT